MSSFQPPKYFDAPPPSWDLKEFLEGELEHATRAGKKAADAYSRATQVWLKSLAALEQADPASDAGKRAHDLLTKFHNVTDQGNDRTRAAHWWASRKRKAARDEKASKENKSTSQSAKRKKATKEPAAKPPKVAVKKTQNVFHGPVVHNSGTWSNADVSSHQGAPQPAEGPIQEPGMPPKPAPTETGSDEPTGRERRRRDSIPAEEPEPNRSSAGESSESDDDEYHDESLHSEGATAKAKRMEEILLGMREVYKRMSNKLPLTSADDCLEDRVYSHASKLPDAQPAHFSILDADTLQDLVSDAAARSAVTARVLPLPVFPAHLQKILTAYEGVQTPAECVEVARSFSSEARLSVCEARDIRWIHGVMQHAAELLTETNGLLAVEGLNEGVWDTMVYTHLWDKHLSTMPDLVLQRKEIQLWAGDAEPYTYLPYLAHYDAVLRTRSKRRRRSSAADASARQWVVPAAAASAAAPSAAPDAELLLIETSSSAPAFGPGSAKWTKDRHKLLGGCRAMLYRLQMLVDGDAATLPQLRVVGVLQAGRCSQVFVMSCLNANVFWCQEGRVRRFPLAIAAEAGGGLEWAVAVGDLLIGVWKARQVVDSTVAAVRRYWKSKADRERQQEGQQRSDAGFL